LVAFHAEYQKGTTAKKQKGPRRSERDPFQAFAALAAVDRHEDGSGNRLKHNFTRKTCAY
jgi:hypothetical protein